MVATAMAMLSGYRKPAAHGDSAAGGDLPVKRIILDGLVVIPVAFFLLATGPKYISGPEVAMFYLLETVLAPVWVWLIFTETPTTQSLIGGSILIAALLAHSLWQLSENRRRHRVQPLRHAP
jgi:drug/metabolite transporter (DMT)-like permease